MNLFTDNPLIERYRFSSLRPKQCWIYGSIFVTIIFVLVMVNLAMFVEQAAYRRVTDFFGSLYYQFFFLLFFVLCVLSASSTSTALRDEFVARSYDFFRMLPLSAHYKAVGILVGRNLLTLILSGVLAVIVIFTGVAGGVSPGLMIQMLFCVVAIAFFFNFMGLFSSINPNRKVNPQQTQSSGAVLAVLLFIPFMIVIMIPASEVDSLEALLIPFYGIDVPLLVLVAVLAIYLSVWLYFGILRRFDRESEPVMTKPGAILFLTGAMIILLGLFGPYMDSDEGSPSVAGYWICSYLIALMLMPAFSLGRQRYMEVRSLNSGMPMSEFLVRHSNLSVSVLLYGIWAVAAVGTAAYSPASINHAVLHVLSLFTFFMAFCMLMEISATTDPLNNRLKVLLAFIGILYIFLPLVAAATLGMGEPAVFSLFGYFGVIADDSDMSYVAAAPLALPVNLLFIALLAIFVRRSYGFLFRVNAGS